MSKKIELLAPAGNYEAFLAAVENGADAVYLGGKLLNARQFAGNFDDEELEKALFYAHVRGVKILLTLNTLVLDEEMQEAVEYAAKAYEMGVDAFILQDVGLAASLKAAIPGIPIHASTQMTTYSIEGVRALEKLGFERVVLARELEIQEIENICKNTGLEIEVFIHGALCISYSGQCLMSSLIGGRSGNRGRCAQPCRLHYSMAKDGKNLKNSYLLSPKDICYIDDLAELVNAGVASLKIEGRMKSPEYVATVVSTYRKYLDLLEPMQGMNPVSGQDRHRLLQSFNRGGFSKGYLRGKTGPEMMAYDKPKNWGTYLGTVLAGDRNSNSVKLRLENTLGNGDGIEIWSGKAYEESPGGIITKIVLDGGKQVKRANSGDTVWVSVIKGSVDKGSKVYKTSDREMLEQAAASYAKFSRKTDVKVDFTLRKDKLPVITLSDFDGNVVTAEGEILPEKAVNKPLTEERISEQLSKMGSTPFNVVELNIDMDNDIVIPISELNNIRRKAAGLLENKRISAGKRKLNFQQYNENFRKELFYSHRDLTYFPGNMPKSIENKIIRNNLQKNKKTRLSAMLYHINKDIELEKLNADRIYIPLNDIPGSALLEQIKNVRSAGKEVYAYISAIIKGKQSQAVIRNAPAVSEAVNGFLVGNMGVTESLRSILGDDVRLFGDYTLNLMNSSALYFLKAEGYSGAALSYELNLTQLNSLEYPPEFAAEVGIYGRIPVMTSEYCPVGGSVGNAAPHKCRTECKNGVYHLKDRKNAAFLVKCDCVDCRSTIFNSDILFAPDLVGNISKSGVEYLRMSFVDESNSEIYDTANLHRDLLEGGKAANEDLIESIKSKGITRGHLHRGV
ncbi:MAG: collagenase-like protease [Eubacterium sp.]|jgi:putative protease|nr:collagenase-like protease [Eubacterium sp.]